MRRISRVLPFALHIALPFVGAPASRAEAQSSQPPQTATMPAAKPEDVQSIDAILAALYDVISGPAGPGAELGSLSLVVHSGRSAHPDEHRARRRGAPSCA
jgi:hypothetical protein